MSDVYLLIGSVVFHFAIGTGGAIIAAGFTEGVLGGARTRGDRILVAISAFMGSALGLWAYVYIQTLETPADSVAAVVNMNPTPREAPLPPRRPTP